jgi:Leucine-rich repeat (LRR) protein
MRYQHVPLCKISLIATVCLTLTPALTRATRNELSELPDEIWLGIFDLLPNQNLKQVSAVNKRLRRISGEILGKRLNKKHNPQQPFVIGRGKIMQQEIAERIQHVKLIDVHNPKQRELLKNYTSLLHLDLSGQTLTAQDLQEIANLCPNLKNLNLRKTQLKADSLDILSQMRNLEYLDLSGNPLNMGIWSCFERLKDLPNLQRLNLRDCGLKEVIHPEKSQATQNRSLFHPSSWGFVKAIVGYLNPRNSDVPNQIFQKETSIPFPQVAPTKNPKVIFPPNLEALDLSGNTLSDWTLAHMENCGQLKSLTLNNNRLAKSNTVEEIIAVYSQVIVLLTEKCPQLSRLELGGNTIFNECLEHLPKLEHLKFLCLDSTYASDSAIEIIAQLPNLLHLSLGPHITHRGLAQLTALPCLESLELTGGQITDESLDLFIRLRNLKFLNLKSTRITPNGIKTLKQQLPYLEKLLVDNQGPIDETDETTDEFDIIYLPK